MLSRSDSGTGFKGVGFDKRRKNWHARIKVNKRSIHLGTFETPEEAFAAYMAAAIKHFGEFAYAGEGSRNVSAA